MRYDWVRTSISRPAVPGDAEQAASLCQAAAERRARETEGEGVQAYEVDGITHFITTTEDSVEIAWERNDCEIVMEYNDSDLDARRIIDSIYVP